MKHRRWIDLTSGKSRHIQLECPEFEWETFESLPQWVELLPVAPAEASGISIAENWRSNGAARLISKA